MFLTVTLIIIHHFCILTCPHWNTFCVCVRQENFKFKRKFTYDGKYLTNVSSGWTVYANMHAWCGTTWVKLSEKPDSAALFKHSSLTWRTVGWLILLDNTWWLMVFENTKHATWIISRSLNRGVGCGGVGFSLLHIVGVDTLWGTLWGSDIHPHLEVVTSKESTVMGSVWERKSEREKTRNRMQRYKYSKERHRE